MSINSRAVEGAQNVLLNCAQLKPHETLVIIHEDPELGWYDANVVNSIEKEAQNMGVQVSLLQVGGPQNERNLEALKAVEEHDCTIFLARIGDQDRFEEVAPGSKTVMCYIRDMEMLASVYGTANHNAFLDLKKAINNILSNADYIQISCGAGTNISGKVIGKEEGVFGDVGVRRFPMGVPQPVEASGMSGQVALIGFLTPTGSKVYDPPSIQIHNTVIANIENGIIIEFDGGKDDVENIERHYKMVSEKFSIQGNYVHSFHAGIHPGISYFLKASHDPDRWANTIFTNPRILHFHTCGNYAPGEICWMIIDHTLTVDDKRLWDKGRLCVHEFQTTRECLEKWPELVPMFAKPAQDIGA